jgi:hypothetical protein
MPAISQHLEQRSSLVRVLLSVTGYDAGWHDVPVSETQPSQDIVSLGQIFTAQSMIEHYS